MTTREKLEKVLEFIINEENEKASDLLHDVFVENDNANLVDGYRFCRKNETGFR